MKTKHFFVRIFPFFMMFFVFVIPTIFGFFIWKQHWYKHQTINQGYYIEPPILISNFLTLNAEDKNFLKGKWLLLYLVPGNCDKSCLDEKKSITNITNSLNKSALSKPIVPAIAISQRVNRKAKPPALHIYYISNDALKNMKLASSVMNELISPQGNYLIIDPQGYIILMYSTASKKNYIYNDLSHLVTVAQ